jgi:hypothetical protein
VVSGSVVFKLHVQGVSAMIGQTSVASFPHRNEEGSSYQYMSGGNFLGRAQRRVDLFS